MLDIQHFLGGHDKEHLVPDMAGLDVGEHTIIIPITAWTNGSPICFRSPLLLRVISKGPKPFYDGSNHNLIGVRNFLSGTPQLAVLLGMTRGGKSAFMRDLLSQTDPYYDFTLIVEEGLSYGIWTQAQGGTPIVIQPDGDMTLNYLDTQGGPLTKLQITTAAALVAKMAGHPADEDRRSLRLAQITQYVEQLYTDRFEEWISEDASRLDIAARHAMAVAEYKSARLPLTATFLEAWTEFQPVASEDERQSLISLWKPEEVSRFLKSPDTDRLVRNTAFAFFQPQDYIRNTGIRP